MQNQKLVLGTTNGLKLPHAEQIKLFKKARFDGFFTEWSKDIDMEAVAAAAKSESMIFQSIHAPFQKAADMWRDDTEKAETAVNELLECLSVCSEYHVPIMVAHAFIGFEEHHPTQAGLERFGTVVEAAEHAGVKIAFENTEGEEYLAALMEEFKGNDTVGFCWDSGHEMCYNGSKDMLALYGDRLIATHLNDNLGVSSFEGRIFWTDDLHLLPFDGIADWDDIAARLDQCGYRDVLTFELIKTSKPGRHDNDCYTLMPAEQYIAEAYKRACRVAAKRKLK